MLAAASEENGTRWFRIDSKLRDQRLVVRLHVAIFNVDSFVGEGSPNFRSDLSGGGSSNVISVQNDYGLVQPAFCRTCKPSVLVNLTGCSMLYSGRWRN